MMAVDDTQVASPAHSVASNTSNTSNHPVLQIDVDSMIGGVERPLRVARHMLQSANAARCLGALYDARDKIEGAIRMLESNPVRASPSLANSGNPGVTSDGTLVGTGIGPLPAGGIVPGTASRGASHSPPVAHSTVGANSYGASANTSPVAVHANPSVPMTLFGSTSGSGTFAMPASPVGAGPASSPFGGVAAAASATFASASGANYATPANAPYASPTSTTFANAANTQQQQAQQQSPQGANLPKRTTPLSRSLTSLSELGRYKSSGNSTNHTLSNLSNLGSYGAPSAFSPTFAHAMASGPTSLGPASNLSGSSSNLTLQPNGSTSNLTLATAPSLRHTYSHGSHGSSPPELDDAMARAYGERAAAEEPSASEEEDEDDEDDDEDMHERGASGLEMRRTPAYGGAGFMAGMGMDGVALGGRRSGSLDLGRPLLAMRGHGLSPLAPGPPPPNSNAPPTNSRKRRHPNTNAAFDPDSLEDRVDKAVKFNSYTATAASDAPGTFVPDAEGAIEVAKSVAEAVVDVAAAVTGGSTGSAENTLPATAGAPPAAVNAFATPAGTASTIRLTLPNPPMRSYPDPSIYDSDPFGLGSTMSGMGVGGIYTVGSMLSGGGLSNASGSSGGPVGYEPFPVTLSSPSAVQGDVFDGGYSGLDINNYLTHGHGLSMVPQQAPMPVYAAGQATAYLPPPLPTQAVSPTSANAAVAFPGRPIAGGRGRAASMSAFPSTTSLAGSAAGSSTAGGMAGGGGSKLHAQLQHPVQGGISVAGSSGAAQVQMAGSSAGVGGVAGVGANPNELGPELRNTIDELFFEYLGEVCSDLNIQDAKGEPIHQTLMAKKMQRLDESPDYRPFRFRIQAFTNRFIDLLASRGFPEDKLPTKKVRHYLWTHPYIARFNEVGKKSKSKGNHIWSVDARKLMPEERANGGNVWVFRHFERRIAGNPSTVAYVGVRWSFAPRVWDPQAPRVGADITWSSPDGGLPSWLRWERGELAGMPDTGDEGGEVHITAMFEEHGSEITLHHKFNLTIAPVGADPQPTSPTRSRRPTIDGAGGTARRGTIDSINSSPIAVSNRRSNEHTVDGLTGSVTKPRRPRRDSALHAPAGLTHISAPPILVPQMSPVAVDQPKLGDQVKQVLDIVMENVNTSMKQNLPNSTRLYLQRQEQALMAASDPSADPPLVQAAQDTVLRAAHHLQQEGGTVLMQNVALATQAAVASAVLLTGEAATELHVMRTANALQSNVPAGAFGVETREKPSVMDSTARPMDESAPNPVAALPVLMAPPPQQQQQQAVPIPVTMDTSSGLMVDSNGMVVNNGMVAPPPMLVPAVAMPQRVQELSMGDMSLAQQQQQQQQQQQFVAMHMQQEQANQLAMMQQASVNMGMGMMPPPQDVVMRSSTPPPMGGFMPTSGPPPDFGMHQHAHAAHMPLL